MKKILIAGAGSYIGESFENWIKQYGEGYQIDTVSTKDGYWKSIDFSGYDVVFQVAGLAHIPKENDCMAEILYSVNAELTRELAEKAKREGVKQYVFMSSKSVYAKSVSVIGRDTVPNPWRLYGKSKLKGEDYLRQLESENFHVALLRSAAVYGTGSPGNYGKIISFAKKAIIFPDVKNEKSLIYIKNLCEFVKQVIDRELTGILFPQDKEYTCTSDIVRITAEFTGHKVYMSRFFGRIIGLGIVLNNYQLRKTFGNSVYKKEISDIGADYCIFGIRDAISEMLSISRK